MNKMNIKDYIKIEYADGRIEYVDRSMLNEEGKKALYGVSPDYVLRKVLKADNDQWEAIAHNSIILRMLMALLDFPSYDSYKVNNFNVCWVFEGQDLEVKIQNFIEETKNDVGRAGNIDLDKPLLGVMDEEE